MIYRARTRIERVLRALGRKVRGAALARGLGRTTVAAAGAVVLTLAVDWLFVLEPAARATVSALCAIALAAFATRTLFLPAVARLSRDGLASILERTHPHLGDRLRSAVAFARDLAPFELQGLLPGDLTGRLKARVIEQAGELARDVDPARAIDTRRVAGSGLRGLVAAAAVAGSFLAAPDLMRAWLERNVFLRDVPWPHETTLIVEGFSGGRRRIPRGDDLEIAVRAEGVIPRRVRIRMRFPAETAVANLARRGDGRFHHTVREVLLPFRFRVEGGDYRTPTYRVDVVPRPEIEMLRIEAAYPAHTGKVREAFPEATGELAIPEGTRLELEGRATKALARAVLRAGEREIEAVVEGGVFQVGLRPERSGPIEIRLEDLEGIPSRSPARILVRLVPDGAPRVRLEAPATSGIVTPAAKVPLAIRIRDDYGLVAAAVAFRARREEEAREGREPLDLDAAGREAEIDHDWEIAPLRFEVGTRLSVFAEATDNDGVSGPKTGRSGAVELRVVSPEAFMEEMIRRQQHQRREWERAIADEKAARDALYRDLPAIRSEDPLPEAAGEALVDSSRMQRDLARRADGIARSLASILGEMENNRVGEVEDIRRLAGRVIRPVEALAAEGFPALAGSFDRVREGASPAARGEAGRALADELERTIARMEAILSNMVKLEGFSEIVKRLRAIMELHDEAAEATRKAYERQLEEIFR